MRRGLLITVIAAATCAVGAGVAGADDTDAPPPARPMSCINVDPSTGWGVRDVDGVACFVGYQGMPVQQPYAGGPVPTYPPGAPVWPCDLPPGNRPPECDPPAVEAAQPVSKAAKAKTATKAQATPVAVSAQLDPIEADPTVWALIALI